MPTSVASGFERLEAGRMRRITALTGAVIAGVIYLGSPMLAAWEIRQAIRTGDKATLEHRVDWTSVRATLNRSLEPAQQVIAEISEAGGAPKPGLWSRIVRATVPLLSGTAVDYYVTPEGVPQLYAWRETWRQKVRPRSACPNRAWRSPAPRSKSPASTRSSRS